MAMQDRAGTNSPLDFEVVGGSEYGSEIFVASVKTESMPEAAGLLVGDQVRGGSREREREGGKEKERERGKERGKERERQRAGRRG